MKKIHSLPIVLLIMSLSFTSMAIAPTIVLLPHTFDQEHTSGPLI